MHSSGVFWIPSPIVMADVNICCSVPSFWVEFELCKQTLGSGPLCSRAGWTSIAVVRGLHLGRYLWNVAKGQAVRWKWRQFSSVVSSLASVILLSSNFRILTERLKVLKFDIVWGDNFSSQPLTLLFYAKQGLWKTGWVFLRGRLASGDGCPSSPLSSGRREGMGGGVTVSGKFSDRKLLLPEQPGTFQEHFSWD